MLSKAEAEDVLRSTDKIHLSDAEKEQYIRSIVHALTSNGIDDEMAKVAEEALKNAKAVENAFGQMALVLGMVDMRYKTTFVLRMYPIFRVCLPGCAKVETREHLCSQITVVCRSPPGQHPTSLQDCPVWGE